jgi:uroporphyrinogen-III synthase
VQAVVAIVTRPADQASAWVADLRAHGIDAAALPLIAIEPPADAEPVRAAWRSLDRRALVLFVSANAVQHFFALRPAGAAWPATTRAAAPGPGTAAALRSQGLQPVEPAADAPAFDSEALWQQLRRQPWAGCSVLVVRGENGRDWLADQLRSAGATVDFLAAYARRPPRPEAGELALLAAARAEPARHLWLFSSSEAVRHLVALGPIVAGARALATHPRIAAAARVAGLAEVIECRPELQAVRLAIEGASIQSGHL